MVNGVFRCLGTNRSIRQRYGDGFELVVKVLQPPEAELPPALLVY